MSTKSAVPTSLRESVEVQFRRLASEWTAGIAHLSSTSEQTRHPAFLAIVGLGDPVIPLLLRELEATTGHWHRALRRITGADPVAEADRGLQPAIRAAWLRWGRDHGYHW